MIKSATIKAMFDELSKIAMSTMPFYRGMSLANKIENVGLKRKGKQTMSQELIGNRLRRASNWLTGE